MASFGKKTAITIAGAILLVAGTAAIASYTTRESLQSDTAVKPKTQVQHQKVASAQPAQPKCDDKNIVGTVAGGVAGGVVGNQFGKGSGKTAATVGGVVGGAVLGNQYIPTRNVTCP
jgi:outer membrane lipoprotein SlyB